MAELAKGHPLFCTARKEIADHPTIGIVARSTGQLFPFSFWRDIGPAAQRMPRTSASTDDMRRLADLLMAGETDFVDRPAHECREIRTVRVVANHAVAGSDRSVGKGELLDVIRLVAMAFKAERGVLFDHLEPGSSFSDVAIGAGKGTNRLVHVFNLDHVLVADSAWAITLTAGSNLSPPPPAA